MDLRLPQLAEGANSGTVVNIMVSEGDKVQKGQPLLELENQKAVAPIPSTVSGTVSKIHVKQGETVTVGQLLVSISEEASASEKPGKPEKPAARREEPKQEEPARPAGAPAPADGSYEYASKSGAPPPASPSVRRIAAELGIDLRRVRGSERGGRITTADLRAYVQSLQQGAAAPAPAAPPQAGAKPKPPAELPDFAKWGPVTRKPVTGLRRTIAEKMLESWSQIPHVTQFADADLTLVLALKEKHEEAYKQKKAALTVTGFLLKAVASTLKKHAGFNASLDLAAGQIVYKNYVHIGVAVDTEAGLIVPVLRDADKKSLLELSRELAELVERTRARKNSPEDLQGGTFTISNQGGIGGAHFTPIIRVPEVAILGVGKGALQPCAVKHGKTVKIEPRMRMPLALSYDHRAVDGADAARFIVDLVQAIEEFPEKQVKP